MKKADKLTEAPKANALKKLALKINELCDLALPIKAGKGIKVVESKEHTVISVSDIEGLPAGYGPEAFTICDSGTPVTRNFITNNPD